MRRWKCEYYATGGNSNNGSSWFSEEVSADSYPNAKAIIVNRNKTDKNFRFLGAHQILDIDIPKKIISNRADSNYSYYDSGVSSGPPIYIEGSNPIYVTVFLFYVLTGVMSAFGDNKFNSLAYDTWEKILLKLWNFILQVCWN